MKLFEQLTSACERKVPLSVPEVPEPEGDMILTEEVFHPVDVEEVGSITLNIINSFNDGALQPGQTPGRRARDRGAGRGDQPGDRDHIRGRGVGNGGDLVGGVVSTRRGRR